MTKDAIHYLVIKLFTEFNFNGQSILPLNDNENSSIGF